MDIKNLKSHLRNDPDKIISILEKLSFHHIKKHNGSEDDYITCGHPDGDNTSSVTIYLNDGLLVIDYTRDLCQSKANCDFLDLVCFFRKDYNFFENLKYVAEESGLGYYHNFNDKTPKSLLILKTLKELINKISESEDEEVEIVPKDEKILSYYYPYVNDLFFDDGISYGTQVIFEIGLDPFSGFITIPIRDEIGTLCGVKGRYFGNIIPKNIPNKYYYLESCPKSKILYGYHITKEFIKESDKVYVTEAEKGCMQLFSYGYKNVLSTGGSKMSKMQIDKISRLGKKIILSFDSDFNEEMIKNLRNKFSSYVDFYAIIDKNGILKEKESPHDNKDNFIRLLSENTYLIEKE